MVGKDLSRFARSRWARSGVVMLLFLLVLVILLATISLHEPADAKLSIGLDIEDVQQRLSGRLLVTTLQNKGVHIDVFDRHVGDPRLIAKLDFDDQMKLCKVTLVKSDESVVGRVLKRLGQFFFQRRKGIGSEKGEPKSDDVKANAGPRLF